jgi:hypothetical protein
LVDVGGGPTERGTTMSRIARATAIVGWLLLLVGALLLSSTVVSGWK